jgi:DNA (cytosine-5)-methyltransferase 1
MGLVLSLFPGIGLLDMAFEEQGFCVVRGPDLLWGGDVHRFHPTPYVFDGVIGGPPCQAFSALVHLNRAIGQEPRHGNLIPEFERVTREAAPTWFLMENVAGAPIPIVAGYIVRDYIVRDQYVGGATMRERRFSFGTRDGLSLDIEYQPLVSNPVAERAVTGDARVASVGDRVRNKRVGTGGVLPKSGQLMPFDEMCRLQGLPETFLSDAPFTSSAKRQMIGNGVPLAMGRAVASAVSRLVAATRDQDAERGHA